MSATAQPLIVVVDDEVQLLKLIATYLESAGMRVQVYERAAPAFRFLQANFANLLLLDVNLPDQSGFDLLAELRKEDIHVPTIFLTGNTQESDRVRGLNLGGDDYVTKPFGYAELVARIHAVLRRTEGRDDFNVTRNARVVDAPFDFCGAQITPVRLEIEFPGSKAVKIGRKELGILAHLHANRGVVLPRKALIHAVWGIHADVTSRSLDQYVVRVRDVFRQHGIELSALRTVHGVGYIFDPEDKAQGKS